MNFIFKILLGICIFSTIAIAANGNVSRPPYEPSCTIVTDSKLCARIGTKFYLIDGNAQLNWFEAQRFCRRHDANLATIESAQELRLISEYLVSKNYDLGDHLFWIGGNDLGSEGTFYSISDGKLLPYTEWTKGQPDNAGGNENCVLLWKKFNGFGMNDEPCSYKAHFMCDFEDRVEENDRETPIFDIRNDWIKAAPTDAEASRKQSRPSTILVNQQRYSNQ